MPNTHRRRRRDETVELSRVGGVNIPAAVVTQFTISCADKWWHNYVIVKEIIKIHEYYTTQLVRMLTNMQRHYGPCMYR